MPLRDHFRPPLSQRRPWESFHTTWASALADHLNDGVLPAGYIALEQIHAGAPAEIDVATWDEPDGGGGAATATRAVWVPAAAPLVLPASFPPPAAPSKSSRPREAGRWRPPSSWSAQATRIAPASACSPPSVPPA